MSPELSSSTVTNVTGSDMWISMKMISTATYDTASSMGLRSSSIYTQTCSRTCLVKEFFSNPHCPFCGQFGGSQCVADVAGFDEQSLDGLYCILGRPRRQDCTVVQRLNALQTQNGKNTSAVCTNQGRFNAKAKPNSRRQMHQNTSIMPACLAEC